MVVISAMTCIYYNVIVMYALIYVCQSLVNIGWSVPWATCGDDWSTDKCRDKPLPKLDTIEEVSERISASLGKFSAGTYHRNDIAIASLPRRNVAPASILRLYDFMCLLD